MSTRRAFLGGLGLAALGATSFGGLLLPRSSGQTGAAVRSLVELPTPFRVPLPIPPVARPARVDADGDHYILTQRHAWQEILPGLVTPIVGYDGIFPGPTIVTRSGRRAVITHRNELSVPVAVHLHGGHTPADSDGFPTDLIAPLAEAAAGAVDAPVASRAYTYPNQQRAATLWYHDHRMDLTGRQVYLGLAGFHLIGDDEDDALPLPRGERDIPLMIADRAFDRDGSFRYPPHRAMDGSATVHEAGMAGVLGDVVLVNGAPWPVLEVAAVRYRLRLLNASNARRYLLRLTPADTPLVQIGTDGGLLDRPIAHLVVALAAGERADVVVDFSAYPPGTAVDLVNDAGSGSTAQVMRFRVGPRAADGSAVPNRLSHTEVLDPARAVRTRDWHFQRGSPDGGPAWTVNGHGFDPRRIDADPRLGELEIWRFRTDLRHPVHVHLNHFQVVSRRGAPPGRSDAGWKDTVDVAAHETVEVAIRFTDYAGRFLLHCHNLEHEDMAMMAAFSTQAPP